MLMQIGPSLGKRGGSSSEMIWPATTQIAGHGVTDAEAIERGLKEKSPEFVEQSADLFAKS